MRNTRRHTSLEIAQQNILTRVQTTKFEARLTTEKCHSDKQLRDTITEISHRGYFMASQYFLSIDQMTFVGLRSQFIGHSIRTGKVDARSVLDLPSWPGVRGQDLVGV